MRSFLEGKPILLGAAVVATTGAAFVVVAACGGQITIGYDDAGNYHTPDGDIFHVGSACVGWDASAYLVDGGLACDASDPQSGASCTALLVPPALPQYTSTCTASGCAPPVWSQSGPATFEFPSCDPGNGGDDFCVAYFDRFITHGHVVAHCAAAGNAPATCTAYADQGCSANAELLPFHVRESDGAVDCVNPCQP